MRFLIPNGWVSSECDLDVMAIRIREEYLVNASGIDLFDVRDAMLGQPVFHRFHAAHSKRQMVRPTVNPVDGWRSHFWVFDDVDLETVVEQPRTSKIEWRARKFLKSEYVSVEGNALIGASGNTRHVMQPIDWQGVGHAFDREMKAGRFSHQSES